MKDGSHRRDPLQTHPQPRSTATGIPAESASCGPPHLSVSAHAIHFSDNGSLLLPLDRRVFPFSGAMQLPGPGVSLLHRKSELHITLIDAEVVRQVCGRMPSDRVLAQARARDWDSDRTGDGAVLGTDDPPLKIIHDGKRLRRNMRREFINEEELHANLRANDIRDVSEVHCAYVEAEGHLTFVKKKR